MQTAPSEYLFVYGTLMRHGGRHELLADHARFLGEGRYSGRLYRVSYYPCVVPSDSSEDWVMGEVFELFDPAATLARLDVYEECGPDDFPPHEYRREKARISIEEGEVDAWIYLYNRDLSSLPRIESGRFGYVDAD